MGAICTGFVYQFLKSPSLIAEVTDDHILAGPPNKDNFLLTPSYYYDLKK
jgi:hypothetical protein